MNHIKCFAAAADKKFNNEVSVNKKQHTSLVGANSLLYEHTVLMAICHFFYSHITRL